MTTVLAIIAGLAFVGVIGGLTLWAVSRLADAGEIPKMLDTDAYQVDPLLPSEREATDLAEYRRSRVIPLHGQRAS